MEDTVIRIQWPKDRWETLQRPIDPSGTRGESWTKKSVWAKKKDPSLLPYNPAIMQALQDRVSTPKYRDELGRAKYPLEETLGKLWEGWKQYSRFGELYYSRERLNQFSEWPAIQELSCRLFDHKAFTSETWERLESWLLTEHLNGDREEFHVIPRKVVVRLLREAVSPKAQ